MTEQIMSKALLAGRVIIVTGAGGGLGRCHALELARHGAIVVVNDLDAGPSEQVAAEIAAAGGTALAVAASVTDEAAIVAMVEQVVARFGRVHGLVNNAGILRDRSFAKMEMDDFRLVLDVHLTGAAICTKAVWAIMREQQFGRIVMTTSSSGLYGNFGQANYAAAKMGLVGLMQTLALEGQRYNVHVNCLAPTAATQMTDDILAPEALTLLDPALVSPAVTFLMSDDAPTRQIICAGAGHYSIAKVTLSEGMQVGSDASAKIDLGRHWSTISRREGAIVPGYGFVQAERELLSAGYAGRALTER